MGKDRRKTVSLGRHKRNRSVCAHQKRIEIEADFVSWRSLAAIAEEWFGRSNQRLPPRPCIRPLCQTAAQCSPALERIIEKAGEVDATAASVAAAVQAYSKINAQGQWIERSESVNLNELFDRMTTAELEAYAQDGRLPQWFTNAIGATTTNSRED